MEPSSKQSAVLIVEDQAPMRQALREFLTLSFSAWQVLEASDAAEGLAQFIEHHPRLVLMDVCLPDGNGIELTRRIKAMAPEVIVVVMSIQNAPVIVEQALGAGAAEFISKDRIFSELPPLIVRLTT
jgi:DNA-binding NarL/FixJ family response regulator